MIQLIQVQDGYELSKDESSIILLAQHSGAVIKCFVHGLSKRDVDAFYQDMQFDLEELLIEKIENEQWDSNGEIHFDAEEL